MELGVGDGRIALRIAQMGIKVIGVDISSRMLNKCREKAHQYQMENFIDLRLGDIRKLDLKEKVPLVILPFRTIGHLLNDRDRLAMFQSVYNILLSRGLFVFDHYIFDFDWAQKHEGIPIPMGERVNSEHRIVTRIFDIYHYDHEKQQMKCEIIIEKSTCAGEMISREMCPLTFSWITPEQIKRLAEKIGFHIECCYGSFNRDRFDYASENQIWKLRKKDNHQKETYD